MDVLIGLLIAWLFCGIWCGIIAEEKGHSAFEFFWIGLMGGPFGLLLAAVMPKRKRRR